MRKNQKGGGCSSDMCIKINNTVNSAQSEINKLHKKVDRLIQRDSETGSAYKYYAGLDKSLDEVLNLLKGKGGTEGGKRRRRTKRKRKRKKSRKKRRTRRKRRKRRR